MVSVQKPHWQAGRLGKANEARRAEPPTCLGRLFCPGLTRGLGWDARESRSGAALCALAVSRASLRAYAARAVTHIHTAPARDAARDDIRRDKE